MARLFAIFLACLIASETLAWSGGTSATQNRSLNHRTTERLIHQMTQQFRQCFRLERNYRYDCYDDAYVRSARLVADNPAYEPARAALDEVGRKITVIVEQNIDPDMPVLRNGFNTYRPVRTSALPASRQKVEDAIEEARTILLRTPENGGDNFQRIAAALESNKVLLRSALLMIGRVFGFA